MSDVTWVVTCMDPDKLKLMLAWLPSEPWPWLDEMQIVTHRNQDVYDALIWVSRHYGGSWPISVRTDIVEREWLHTIDAPHALRTYFDDLLGVKLMLPLTVLRPMLFTDDDVVVTRDPGDLLSRTMWGSHSGLDGYTETAKDLDALDALCTAVGKDIPMPVYNELRTDAGVWYLPPTFNPEDYKQTLVSYFSTRHVSNVSQDVGTAPHDHTQRFRKLDQRFLSGYMISRGGFGIAGKHYRGLATKNIPKAVPDATFIHYCASGQKPRYMEWLWKNLPSSS